MGDVLLIAPAFRRVRVVADQVTCRRSCSGDGRGTRCSRSGRCRPCGRCADSELATGLDLSSGAKGESVRLDLSLGGEFKMSRENQIIADITGSLERNQYNGQANQTDPETGVRPRGVFVDNTFVIFSLGYRWGQ